MPYHELPQHRLHYRVDENDPGKPWLIFCNSLGTDLHMWDGQIEAVAPDFRILRYDRRGHGLSSAPVGPFTLADLAADVLSLMDGLAVERAHFCGLSIGGLVGQWLAIHAAHRFNRFIFCATAARIGSPAAWQERIETVEASGLSTLLAGTADRWFTPQFRSSAPDVVGSFMKTFQSTSPAGYLGCCAALRDADLRSELAKIHHPVLTVSGEDDAVCPVGDLELIANSVSYGRNVSLPGRHIVNLEFAGRFNENVAGFLREANN